MLLSRFAESLYWAGRYLERAEATARLIKEHTELLLDLPRAAGVGWSPLLAVTGCTDEFLGRHTGPEEEDVIDFLTADPKNRGSVLASLGQARVNLLASRVVLPRPSWEVVNNLHGWAVVSADQAIDRRTRLGWMDGVITQCELFAGSLANCMNDDEAYGFLQIGRHLERADMTIRVLDVQAGILVGQPEERDPVGASYRDVTWMSVLRSLSAQQMFFRTVGGGVSGPAALRFLLQDDRFPRSVEFCLSAAARGLGRLPRATPSLTSCGQAQERLRSLSITDQVTPRELNELVDELEIGIGEVHQTLARTYFPEVVIPVEASA
jgi:uncharacterized alpha-E superfamily protein